MRRSGRDDSGIILPRSRGRLEACGTAGWKPAFLTLRDQTRFSPTGTGPTMPREVGVFPIRERIAFVRSA